METVFLAIFIFGGLFTLASAVLGAVSSVDHGFGHGQAHGDGTHGIHADHGHGHGSAEWLSNLPLLNGSAVMGFLTWFGAAGFLLLKLSDWALPAVMLGAVIGGSVGAYLVARYLHLVLKGERVMDPADYRLEGTVGQLTISIPQGGTGEVVFSKAGTRRSEAARSLGGLPIPRGTEVVITEYVGGKAIVQPWAEFIAAREGVAAPDNTEVTS
jgi:membrane protein implicated in regulation of membrane protease activity